MLTARADALAGCLLGQALGDALGFVVEAEPAAVAREYVRTMLRAGRAGERSRPGFVFGQYSDDTQLARELLRSVREREAWDPAAYAARLAELFREGKDVGAGQGTRSAALRLLMQVPWDESGTPPPYAGNGSAMRAAPLGLLFPQDPVAMCRAARDQSRITHRDSRCTAGAMTVAGAAALAATRGPIDPPAFLTQLADWVGPESSSIADALAGMAEWRGLEPETAARHVQQAALDPAQGDRWQGISAVVTQSVLWSLYSFLRTPDDYWATVCTAIAVGGDTDTMAAMAGAMSGARLGVAALPGVLLERLTDRGTWGATELVELAQACAELAGEGGLRSSLTMRM
jgi:ADP-ribosylglycohydrolase